MTVTIHNANNVERKYTYFVKVDLKKYINCLHCRFGEIATKDGHNF